MSNKEKRLNQEIKQLNEPEQRMTSGGYAPIKPPFKPLEDNNGIPDFKMPSEEDFRCY